MLMVVMSGLLSSCRQSKDDEALALNLKAQQCFRRMDFDNARALHEKAMRITDNELLRFGCEVGLMAVYERTSQNREFFDARNKAESHIRRIEEEMDGLTDEEKRRFYISKDIYHYVSSNYFHNQYQDTLSQREARLISPNFKLGDVAMHDTIYYHEILDRLINARIAFEQEDYTQSIALCDSALQAINRHHLKYYPADSQHLLHLYSEQDSVSTEKIWLDNPDVHTVPEVLAQIREQASMSYAAMGLTKESYYNRNAYLDILDVIRQDKEWESRYDELNEANQRVTMIFISAIVLVVVIVLICLVANEKWKKRNERRVENLRLTLELCHKIAVNVSDDVSSGRELLDTVTEAVQSDFRKIFGFGFVLDVPGIDDEDDDAMPRWSELNMRLVGSVRVSSDKKSLLRVIEKYFRWVLQSGADVLAISNNQRKTEAEKYIHEQHIAANKRQNLDKRACMSMVNGITPYLDRAINEVNKLQRNESDDVKRTRYQYIIELIDKINEYNDIMASWVQLRKGEVSLNIDSFALQPLFSILSKARTNYAQKDITLTVSMTPAIVKADKALTLFMINTLAENARKYTPAGGHIEVYAEEADDYVEVSVKDSGIGISEEDCRKIIEEKVYDSSTIGIRKDADNTELSKNKGHGFGLMNCRGIIEKYKKTNPLFAVCQFGVESTLGKGSRFFFRLPKGVKKALMLAVVMILSAPSFAKVSNDSVWKAKDSLLRKASAYADTVYFCNVKGLHTDAIYYSSLAMRELNKYYRKYHRNSPDTMSVDGNADRAEIKWWNEGFDTDYHVILDVRNETAIAALVLKEWNCYNANNQAYTKMYKMLGQDTNLAEYCRKAQNKNTNTTIAMWLVFIAVLVALFSYYLLYFRHKVIYTLNLRQLLSINNTVMKTLVQHANVQDADYELVAKNVVDSITYELNDLLPIHGFGLAIADSETNTLYYSITQEVVESELMKELMRRAYDTREVVVSQSGYLRCFPLFVPQDNTKCVGIFSIIYSTKHPGKGDEFLVSLLVNFMSTILAQSVIRISQRFRDLEMLEDEKRRAQHEENMLHIQNMVMDNCLSAIKHETMYYPSRIRIMAENGAEASEIKEIIQYYKEVFGILCQCASRQLEQVLFKRTTVSVADVFASARKSFARMQKKAECSLTLSMAEPTDASIITDKHLIAYLVENLLQEAFAFVRDGEVELTAQKTGTGFVRFGFTDKRRRFDEKYLNEMFYPSMNGEKINLEYLLCKQIIRDHDEYTGIRGCRIDAEPCAGGGFTVSFVLPEARS